MNNDKIHINRMNIKNWSEKPKLKLVSGFKVQEKVLKTSITGFSLHKAQLSINDDVR